MNTPRFVPVVPDSAPFSPEQRAWLNGFLAGLFSFSPVPNQTESSTVAPDPRSSQPLSRTLSPLAILVGSQTGNAEKLAKRVAKTAAQRGFAPVIHDLARTSPTQLASESSILVVTSTYGDGEPPDNAKPFWHALRSPDAPRLEHARFSIFALGDANYPRFCQFGKDLDARFESLGARRVHPRQDCDVDYDQPFAAWIGPALERLAAPSEGAPTGPAVSPASPVESTAGSNPDPSTEAEPTWHRDRPFPARLTVNRRLTAESSEKDIRHFVVDLHGSDLAYEAGDALGVWPENDPRLVDRVLQALGAQGEELVPDRNGNPAPVRDALARHYDLVRIPRPLLSYLSSRVTDPTLAEVTSPDANGALDRFLRGRDVLDLLTQYPEARLDPATLMPLLRRLQPRLYSIASSPRLHPHQIHLCVAVVRYESLGRPRLGLASGWLAERVSSDDPIPAFVHANPAFRPPPPDRPLVMIGPGTGIAPFRAFLQDRLAQGASGRNWIFFGAPREHSDFLYAEEFRTWQREGALARLDLAWSRDQQEKIYVQHRMLEHAALLWDWLESGAAIYVCGDASRMAKDVDAALHDVVRTGGQRSREQAEEYVRQLAAQGRYRRDVY